jgi:hypothetical protein
MMGEFLRQTPKANGGEHGGKAALDGSRREPSNPTPTLANLGITKKESAAAQALAEARESAPELHEQAKAGKVSVRQAVLKVKSEERRERNKCGSSRGPHSHPGRPPTLWRAGRAHSRDGYPADGRGRTTGGRWGYSAAPHRPQPGLGSGPRGPGPVVGAWRRDLVEGAAAPVPERQHAQVGAQVAVLRRGDVQDDVRPPAPRTGGGVRLGRHAPSVPPRRRRGKRASRQGRPSGGYPWRLRQGPWRSVCRAISLPGGLRRSTPDRRSCATPGGKNTAAPDSRSGAAAATDLRTRCGAGSILPGRQVRRQTPAACPAGASSGRGQQAESAASKST